MTSSLVLGIDLGSSGCRAFVVDAEGNVQGRGRARHEIRRDQGGAAEQHPDDWWRALVAAVRSALQDFGGSPELVVALAVSGQASTHVLLDSAGAPLGHALSWQDGRPAQHARRARDLVGRESLAQSLGVDLPIAASWPLSRMLWMKEMWPAEFEHARRLAVPKDYVVSRLSGQVITDAQSWRGLLRMPDGTPPTELLDALDLPTDLVLNVQSPELVAGGLTPAAADELGLRPGTIVATGWHDLSAALAGMDALGGGVCFEVGGTSSHVGVCLPRQKSPDRDFPDLIRAPLDAATIAHSIDVLYGVTSSAGGALEWWMRAVDPAARPSMPVGHVEQLLNEAGRVPAGAGGLLFLPYLNGERSPIWDSGARGAFVGLRSHHDTANLTRAVLEGVALSLRHVLDLVDSASPSSTERIRSCGGPSRSPQWNQIKASVLQRPVQVMREPDASCMGAAVIAAVASSWYRTIPEAAAAMTAVDGEVEPQTHEVARYDELFELYRQAYPACREIFHGLGRMERSEEAS